MASTACRSARRAVRRPVGRLEPIAFRHGGVRRHRSPQAVPGRANRRSSTSSVKVPPAGGYPRRPARGQRFRGFVPNLRTFGVSRGNWSARGEHAGEPEGAGNVVRAGQELFCSRCAGPYGVAAITACRGCDCGRTTPRAGASGLSRGEQRLHGPEVVADEQSRQRHRDPRLAPPGQRAATATRRQHAPLRTRRPGTYAFTSEDRALMVVRMACSTTVVRLGLTRGRSRMWKRLQGS